MDEFAERLADLANLPDEELAGLEQELVAAFQAADQGGDVDTMQDLADAIDQVREELAKRQAPAEGAEAVPGGAPPGPPPGVPASAAAPAATTADAAPAPTAEAPPVATQPANAVNTAPAASDTPAAEPPAEAPAPEPAPATEPAPAEAPAPAEEPASAPEAAPDAPDRNDDGNGAQAEAAVAADTPSPDAEAPAATDSTTDTDETTPTTDPATDAETTPTAAAEPDATSTSPDPSTPPTEEEAEVAAEISNEIPPENQPDEALAASPQPLVPTIRVGGDIPGYTAGAELPDFENVIEAMTTKVNNLRGIGGDGEHILVASMRFEETQDEDHFLRQGDPDGNSRKIRRLISDPEQLTPQALLSAGWCAPSAPIYDVPTIGTTDRPIKSALPSFTADRGSINWMSPPSLPNEFSTDAFHNAAFGVWAEKATPPGTGGPNYAEQSKPITVPGSGTATATTPPGLKPCFDVPCGTEQNAALDALTICLCFDNLMARAFPEWIRANTELTMVAQARWAEQWLMYQMWNSLPLGTPCVIGTPDVTLGAARDFLTTLRLVASQFRWRNRISPTAPLQVLLPSWLHEAMIDDLAIQIPGDNTISLSVAEIDGYISDLNVQPIWYIDDVPTGAGGATAVSADAAFDSYCGFPATAEWLLFPTGTFVRLDGGSLDLGVVRSKEDIQRNKYCEFSETFEGVAYMGPMDTDSAGSWVVRGQTAIEVRGGFAPAVPEIADGGTLSEAPATP